MKTLKRILSLLVAVAIVLSVAPTGLFTPVSAVTTLASSSTPAYYLRRLMVGHYNLNDLTGTGDNYYQINGTGNANLDVALTRSQMEGWSSLNPGVTWNAQAVSDLIDNYLREEPAGSGNYYFAFKFPTLVQKTNVNSNYTNTFPFWSDTPITQPLSGGGTFVFRLKDEGALANYLAYDASGIITANTAAYSRQLVMTVDDGDIAEGVSLSARTKLTVPENIVLKAADLTLDASAKPAAIEGAGYIWVSGTVTNAENISGPSILKYVTSAEAFTAALADADFDGVVLGADIEVDDVAISAGKTIDFNGNVLTCESYANSGTECHKEEGSIVLTTAVSPDACTKEELDTALLGAKNITLLADIDYAAVLTIPTGVTLDLNGHNLYVTGLVNNGTLTKNSGKLWANVSTNTQLSAAPTTANVANFWAAQEELLRDGTEFDGIKLTANLSSANSAAGSEANTQNYIPLLYATGAYAVSTSNSALYFLGQIPAGKTLDLNGKAIMFCAVTTSMGEGSIIDTAGTSGRVRLYVNDSGNRGTYENALAVANSRPSEKVFRILQAAGDVDYAGLDPIPVNAFFAVSSGTASNITMLVADQAGLRREGYADAKTTGITLKLTNDLTLTGDVDVGSANVDYDNHSVTGGVIITTGEKYNKPQSDEPIVVASGECGDNLTWTLDEEGTLTISGTGAMTDWAGSSSMPWYGNRGSIETVIIGEGVTRIGTYAFYGCDSLASVTIPVSMTSVGSNAFYGPNSYVSGTVAHLHVYYDGTLEQWKAISISSGNTKLIYEGLYSGSSRPRCTIHFVELGLTLVSYGTCGDNLTWTLTDEGTLTISGTGAMWNYDNEGDGDDATPWDSNKITTAIIESGVTSIGTQAFYYCTKLTSVTIPDSVTSIGDWAFEGCTGLTSVTIPDSVTSIGWGAFSGCSSLTSVTIPDSVTSIGTSAFSGCDSLTSVTIPNSVTSIGASAFHSCDSLTSITVSPDNTVYSSQNGLLYNKDQTTLVCYPGGQSGAFSIPTSVTSIGTSAFSGCSSLTSVTIPDSVTSIGDWAFRGCSGLTSVTIPNSVTSIGNYAFSNCDSLTSVTIPNSVTSFGNSVFYGCSGLTSVVIPDGVTSIGGGAFRNCDSLTSVEIPDSVTSIGWSAFEYCDSLTSVTIPDSVTSIGDYAFGYCTALTDVFYTGTQEQWNAIAIGDSNSIGSNNIPLTSATKHFNWTPDVATKDELEAALLGAKNITLLADIDYAAVLTIPTGVTVDLNGHNLYVTGLVNNGTLTKNGGKLWANVGANTQLTAAPTTANVANFWAAQEELLRDGTEFDGIKLTANLSSANSAAGGEANTQNYIPLLYATGAYAVSTSNSALYFLGQIPAGKTLDLNGKAIMFCAVTTSMGEGSIIDTAGTSGRVRLYVNDSGNRGTYENAVAVANSRPSEKVFRILQAAGTVDYTGLDPIPVNAFFAVSGGSASNITMLVADQADLTREGYAGANTTGITLKLANDLVLTGNVSVGSANVDYDNHSVTGGVIVTTGEKYNKPQSEPVTIASGTWGDNLTWTLNDDLLLTITGTGAMMDYGCSDEESLWGGRSSVVSIVIGDGVTSIGNGVFYSCSSLKSVEIPDSVTSIENYAFSSCYSLTSVEIPDGVTSIGGGAFFNCDSLTSIEIPDSVTSIGGSAFGNCFRLASVTISASVTSIGEGAFSDCGSLTSITVASGNENYSSQDGVLYNKDGTTLICCPGGKSGTFTIPNGVTSIGSWAFYCCHSLTSVEIPDSVTSIGNYAFNSCTALTDVYYGGTQVQWDAITIGGSNYSLTGATIHFNWTPDVATKDELDAALSGATTITLTADIDYNAVLTIPTGVTVDLNGHNLYVTGLVNNGTLTKNSGKLWANVSTYATLASTPSAADVSNIWAANEELLREGTQFDGIRLTANLTSYSNAVTTGAEANKSSILPRMAAEGAFVNGLYRATLRIPAGKTLDLNGHKLVMLAANNTMGTSTLGDGTVLANGGEIELRVHNQSTFRFAVAIANNYPGIVTMIRHNNTTGSVNTLGNSSTIPTPVPAGVALATNGCELNSVVFMCATKDDFTRVGTNAEHINVIGFKLANNITLTQDLNLGDRMLYLKDDYSINLNGHKINTTGTIRAEIKSLEDLLRADMAAATEVRIKADITLDEDLDLRGKDFNIGNDAEGNGYTFNLAGHTLDLGDGALTSNFGFITDASTADAGNHSFGLVKASSVSVAHTGRNLDITGMDEATDPAVRNAYQPLYDSAAGGYRFFRIENNIRTAAAMENGKLTFKFIFNFSNAAAWDYVLEGDSEMAFWFSLKSAKTLDTEADEVHYYLNAATMADYAAKQKKQVGQDGQYVLTASIAAPYYSDEEHFDYRDKYVWSDPYLGSTQTSAFAYENHGNTKFSPKYFNGYEVVNP